MEGFCLVFLVEKEQIVFHKRVLHELILAVLAQHQMDLLKHFSLDFVKLKVSNASKGVFLMRARVRTGIFKEDLRVLVREDMDGDEAPFFPWVDGNTAKMTILDFHHSSRILLATLYFSCLPESKDALCLAKIVKSASNVNPLFVVVPSRIVVLPGIRSLSTSCSPGGIVS